MLRGKWEVLPSIDDVQALQSESSSRDGDVAFTANGKAVYVKRSGTDTLERVANLQGTKSVIWAGTGKQKSVLIGYANGLIRMLSLDKRSESKEFVIHGGGIERMCTMHHRSGDRIWVLYEDKVIVSVPFASMVSSPSWSDLEPLKVWKLKQQESIYAFAAFPLTASYHYTECMFSEETVMDQTFCILTVGSKPSWALYVTESLKETQQRSGVLSQLASSVASTLGTNVVSFAKSWAFSGWRNGAQEQQSNRKEQSQTTSSSSSPGKETSLVPRHSIYDSTSRVLSKTINSNDPSGRYCVCADNFGRVMLLDTNGLRVVKVWKGYRDAQTSWLSCPERWAGQWKERSETEPMSVQQAVGNKRIVRWGQFLAILAPWRQTLQIWRVPGCILVSSLRLPAAYRPEDIFLSTCMDRFGVATSNLLVRDKENGKLTSFRIELDVAAIERLHVHLSRGKNQKESFAAHQLSHALSNGSTDRVFELFAKAGSIDALWKLLYVFDHHTPSPPSFTHPVHLKLIQVVNGQIQVHLEKLREKDSSDKSWTTKQKRDTELSIAPSAKALTNDQHIKRCELFAKVMANRKKAIELHGSIQVSQQAQDDLEEQVLSSDACLFGSKKVHLGDIQRVLYQTEAPTSEPLSLREFILLSGTCIVPDTLSLVPSVLERFSGSLDLKDRFQFLSDAKRAGLASLLFSPLLADLFLLPRVDALVKTLGISLHQLVDLFLQWWFSVDIHSLNTVLSSSPRNGIVKFLERFKIEANTNKSLEDKQKTSSDDEDIDDDASGSEEHSDENDDSDALDMEDGVVFANAVKHVVETSHQLCHAFILVSVSLSSKVVDASQTAREELTKLQDKLSKTIAVGIRLKDTVDGSLSLLSLEESGQHSLTARLGKALASSTFDEEDKAKVEQLVPEQFDVGHDAILSHRALCLLAKTEGLADGKVQEDSIMCLRQIRDSRVVGGLGLTIWNTVLLPALGQVLATKHGSQDGILLCEFSLKVLDILLEVSRQPPPQPGSEGPFSLASSCWPPVDLTLPCALVHDFEKLEDSGQNSFSKARMAVVALQALSKLTALKTGDDKRIEPPVREILLGTLLSQLFLRGESVLEPIPSSDGKEARAKDGAEESENSLIASRRLQLVQRLLRSCDLEREKEVVTCFETASVLGVPLDKVRQEHTQVLYARGLDTLGEVALSKVEDKNAVGLMLLAVARSRMSAILNNIQESAKHRHLLAVISADTSRWIRAAATTTSSGLGGSTALQQQRSRMGVDINSEETSLSSTLVLLRRVQSLIDETSPTRNRAAQMVRAADALWRRIQEMMR